MNRPYDDLTVEQRAQQIADDIRSVFEARTKGDRAAAEVNLMHSYHSGASALELAEAIEAEVMSR